ncbi:MAG: hypothetical protein R3B90_21400 [Planctomycetaceae bacterium]
MQEKFSRRRLPHWDLPGATYFITTCLADSIPAQGQLELARLRSQLQRTARPPNMAAHEWAARRWKSLFVQFDDWLDHHPASRLLEHSSAADIVVESLKHFAGQRYDLIAWVVMPSHLHWVFRPRDEWVASLGDAVNQRPPRQRIQFTLNTHTALECNRLLGRSGRFWQWESYDHCVTDEDELERIVAYVHANPVTAGLVERPESYRWSSAATHLDLERHP